MCGAGVEGAIAGNARVLQLLPQAVREALSGTGGHWWPLASDNSHVCQQLLSSTSLLARPAHPTASPLPLAAGMSRWLAHMKFDAGLSSSRTTPCVVVLLLGLGVCVCRADVSQARAHSKRSPDNCMGRSPAIWRRYHRASIRAREGRT